jgi:hypothetical protein
MQREIVDRISRGIIGYGIIGAGYAMAASGLAKGNPDRDKDVSYYERYLGKSANAIKTGDRYTTFGNLQPIAMPFGMGAEAQESSKLMSADVAITIIDSIATALDYYSDQPMLQSIQKFLGSRYDGKTVPQRVIDASLELPKQFVPTIFKQVRQIADPYQRETYSENYIDRTLLNPIKDKLPLGISATLPIKSDTEGNDLKNYQGDNNWFNIFANPLQSTSFKPNATQQEILRLYDEAGSKIQIPTAVEKYIDKTKDHPRVTLTAKEFTQYQKMTGQYTMQEFSKMINSDRYRNIKATDKQTIDERRAKLLADIISEAKAKAKLYILKGRGYSK